MENSSLKSIIGSLVAILVGVGVGIAGSQGGAKLGGISLMLLAVVGAYLI